MSIDTTTKILLTLGDQGLIPARNSLKQWAHPNQLIEWLAVSDQLAQVDKMAVTDQSSIQEIEHHS